MTLKCSRHSNFVGICDECVAANFNRSKIMNIPYPTFQKLIDASAEGVPVARIAMAALMMLGQTREMKDKLPGEVFDFVLRFAKAEPDDHPGKLTFSDQEERMARYKRLISQGWGETEAHEMAWPRVVTTFGNYKVTTKVEGRNTGHGHVFPRPDGVLARCGGPGPCEECSRDLARKMRAEG